MRTVEPTEARSSRAHPDPIEAGSALSSELARLRHEVASYVIGRLAAANVALRQFAFRVVLALVVLVALLGLLFAGTWQLVRGLAGAFALIDPDLPWLGPLCAGASVLALFVLGLFAVRWSLVSAVRKRAVEKLERRRKESTGAA